MARDEHGEIPDPWAHTRHARSFREPRFVPTYRPCVGGPLHTGMLPEEELAAVVEDQHGAHHTYKLMRDIASGELCYVHIGSTGGEGGSTGSDPVPKVALGRR
jgi:hypothetical protein